MALLVAIIVGLSLAVSISNAEAANNGMVGKVAEHLCHNADIAWRDVLRADMAEAGFTRNIESVFDKFKERFGQCYSFSFGAGSQVGKIAVNFNFDSATVPSEFNLSDGYIAGLFFSFPIIQNDSFQKIASDLENLPGRSSALIMDGAGDEVFAFNADDVLAIGSTFKLFVLSELKDMIRRGIAKESDVIYLKPKNISYPSGILQLWPVDTPMTLQSLATLMISKSDNTASDTLIDFVGRKSLEERAPHSRPFLTTKETFLLKDAPHTNVGARYAAANESGKRSLLKKLGIDAHPQMDFASSKPRYISDIEWFASVKELCGVALPLVGDPILSVNPGLIKDDGHWKYIGYKGGSENGVLQLTYVLKDRSGRIWCVSETWNDEKDSLDENRFYEIVNRTLKIIQSLPPPAIRRSKY